MGTRRVGQPGLYQHPDVVIASPRPVRAVTRYENERFVTAPYNTKVDHPDNRHTAQDTVPVASSTRLVNAINIDHSAFEDINLDHDDHSAAWTQNKRPATPAVTISACPDSCNKSSSTKIVHSRPVGAENAAKEEP